MFKLIRFVALRPLAVALISVVLGVVVAMAAVWSVGRNIETGKIAELRKQLDFYSLTLHGETVNGNIMGAVELLGVVPNFIKRQAAGEFRRMPKPL